MQLHKGSMTGVLLLGQGDWAGLGQGGGQAEHLLVRGRGLRRGRRVDHDLELVPGDPTHNRLQGVISYNQPLTCRPDPCPQS